PAPPLGSPPGRSHRQGSLQSGTPGPYSYFAFRRLFAATLVCIPRLSFKGVNVGIPPHPINGSEQPGLPHFVLEILMVTFPLSHMRWVGLGCALLLFAGGADAGETAAVPGSADGSGSTGATGSASAPAAPA